MIDNIGGIIVLVSNQNDAIEFYKTKLGFDIKFETPYKNTKWVELAPKNSTTTISLIEPNSDMMSEDEIELAKKQIGIKTKIWFYTKDITQTYSELKDKGVNVTEPKEQDWGGIISSVYDQDNNSFEIVSSPKDHEHSDQ